MSMINKGAETLPNKDAQAYKQLAKFYDARNYKKGLKHADKLLETHPDHPQTLALKALFLLALNEENKALEIAKLSLIKSKMQSMLSWHTCGTIYKQRKDFFEAAKCFQNALKKEPDNLNLMRETASLQIQTRDHFSHTASRFSILKLKPNMIQNWVGFTLAHHLRGDFPSLFKALSSLDNLIKTTELKPTELAHYYLYRVIAYRDAQQFEQMYEQLKRNKDKIKDDVLYHELLHNCCQQLQKNKEAEEALEYLLVKFPQNRQYLQQYQAVTSLDRVTTFQQAQSKFNSKLAKIYELCYIQDEKIFRQKLSQFIKPYFQKNLVSLFAELQLVYQAGKHDLIQTVLLEYENSLANNKYPDGEDVLSPSEHLWSLYLLAQHYSLSFHTLPLALIYINKAIAHTCTVSQFYIVKASIEYQQHNNLQSLKTINQARKTDLADRYMNNICVRYLMKLQQPDLAESVLRLFMRDQASLYELQNHWYILEAAKSHLKQRNLEAGLKHLDIISKHFLDFQANQFDFHSYCLRKWTLREYTQLIQFNDNIYDDKKYIQTAGLAIKYLQEYVYKIKEDEIAAKVEAEKKAKEEETQQSQKSKKKKKKVVENTQQEQLPPQEAFRKKLDYYGKQYAQKIKKNPLDEALNYAKCVSTIKYTNKDNEIENKIYGKAFQQAIQIFIIYNKPLLVLRCLHKLNRTKFCPFTLHLTNLRVLSFFYQYIQKQTKPQELVLQHIQQYLKSQLNGKTILEYHEQEQKKWQNVPKKLHYLIQIKKQEASLILTSKDIRSDLISFHKNSLSQLEQQKQITSVVLQQIFYHVHQLEFYGQMPSEWKSSLHNLLKSHTSYFSNWKQEITKLPPSTWTMWWLSDYDIQRQEEEEKEEKLRQQKKEGKEQKKEDKDLETKTQ